MANYLQQPYNSALSNGTGGFDILFWLKEAANSADEVIFERDSASTAQRYTFQVNSAGTVSFTCDDNTTARTATSTVTADDSVWHLYLARYDGAGGVYVYRDGSGTAIASATGAALLTLDNTSAVFRVGLSVAGTNPATNANVVMLRHTVTNISSDDFAFIYNQERPLFQAGSKATLVGSSNAITSMDWNEYKQQLYVGTSGGKSVFSGLRRVDEDTGTAITTIASEGHYEVIN